MSVPAYPAYRDSGVEWLSQVPLDWQVLAIKRLSPVQRGASPRPIDDPKYFDDDGVYTWVRISDVSGCDGRLRETTQRLSDLGSSLSVKIEPGELFVSIAGTVGKPCITAIRACIHDGFVYFPRLQINAEFLFRIFEAGHCYAGLGKFGTQLNLNTDTIGAIKIALPPPQQIEAILTFLDRETGKIDALVAEQERLIALLKEKRQAFISQAVTKGLDANVPMKDSGIEWLGQVPAHWGIVPIKHLVRFVGGGTPSKDREEYWLGDIPWVSPKDMKKWVVNGESDGLTPEAVAATNLAMIPDGAVLIVVRGMILAHSFPVALSGRLLTINQDMKALLPSARVRAPFLAYSLAAFRAAIAEFVDEAGHGTRALRMEGFGAFPLPVPPPDEQSAIAAFIDAELDRLDALSVEAERAVALLRERRAALISAAVTGKIDVRGLVAPAEAKAA